MVQGEFVISLRKIDLKNTRSVHNIDFFGFWVDGHISQIGKGMRGKLGN